MHIRVHTWDTSVLWLLRTVFWDHCSPSWLNTHNAAQVALTSPQPPPPGWNERHESPCPTSPCLQTVFSNSVPAAWIVKHVSAERHIQWWSKNLRNPGVVVYARNSSIWTVQASLGYKVMRFLKTKKSLSKGLGKSHWSVGPQIPSHIATDYHTCTALLVWSPPSYRSIAHSYSWYKT